MKFTKIHCKRCMKWADAIEGVPTQHFNMNVVARSDAGKERLRKTLINDAVFECNTAGCAFGYLPAVFPRRFSWREGFYKNEFNIVDRVLGICLTHDGVCKYLGLDGWEMERICCSACYTQIKITPNKVADRIRKIVREKAY